MQLFSVTTEIRELFRLFDTNNDRSISVTELGKAMRFLGMSPSPEEVSDAMRSLDVNGIPLLKSHVPVVSVHINLYTYM